jgi:hypothetical protein
MHSHERTLRDYRRTPLVTPARPAAPIRPPAPTFYPSDLAAYTLLGIVATKLGDLETVEVGAMILACGVRVYVCVCVRACVAV